VAIAGRVAAEGGFASMLQPTRVKLTLTNKITCLDIRRLMESTLDTWLLRIIMPTFSPFGQALGSYDRELP